MATEEGVDVLICGSGSAGICAATYLAKCGVKCIILESRNGPLTLGQADGVQCRTVEIFESFGLSEELLRESYHVLEVTFWSSTPTSRTPNSEGPILHTIEPIIERTARTADTQPGLSHQPHVILNQARVNGLLLNAMVDYNDQRVEYGYTVKRVEVDESLALDPSAHCVKVVVEKEGVERTLKAKYVLGCDGAHSVVRKSLGFSMIGDSTDSVWGVMDIYPLTNFPDIRKKVVIKAAAGSMLIVPREGGELVRFYIELPVGTQAKQVSISNLLDTATKILAPYTLRAAGVVWWSAYSIGQRVANNFTKHDRVFLTGDACHTHSPKAGQGMNVSLQDGYNLGWKLAAVLKGQATPELLKTYATERGKVANELVAFDREFARNFSSRPSPNENVSSADSFTKHFIKSGVYTAGFSARNPETIITNSNKSKPHHASKVRVGMSFPSAQVVRVCDARAMQLHKTLKSDGRWRLLIFPGDISEAKAAERLRQLGDYLDSKKGIIRKFTPPSQDMDSIIESIVILSGQRADIEQNQMPAVFRPHVGKWKLRDLHKVFIDDMSYNSGHGHAYDFYGIDPKEGAMIVVRPDQYTSLVLALEDVDTLRSFFDGFLVSN